MKLQNAKINFLGDSITEGVGLSDQNHHYFDYLRESAGLAVTRNYGISGTRIARQKKPTVDAPSFDLDFCLRAEQMDPDADAVVVFGGTNDYGHGDAPIGKPSDRTPDTFYGAMHTLIQILYRRYPGKEIVFMTPLHRSEENLTEMPHEAPLSRYVEIIREVCEIYSVPVLDLFAHSGIAPALPIHQETFCPDGLHPNDFGHARIASRLENFLRNL